MFIWMKMLMCLWRLFYALVGLRRQQPIKQDNLAKLMPSNWSML
ncbi:hypothetical protein CKA32_000539 [Geitlerinema sp. FC II]|nr:hypothetical protein CKA32_000539 [Geitlerinema sp. FC II]